MTGSKGAWVEHCIQGRENGLLWRYAPSPLTTLWVYRSEHQHLALIPQNLTQSLTLGIGSILT